MDIQKPKTYALSNLNVNKAVILGYDRIFPDYDDMITLAKVYPDYTHIIIGLNETNMYTDIRINNVQADRARMFVRCIPNTDFLKIRVLDAEADRMVNIYFDTRTCEYVIGYECIPFSPINTLDDKVFMDTDYRVWSIYKNNLSYAQLPSDFRYPMIQIWNHFMEITANHFISKHLRKHKILIKMSEHGDTNEVVKSNYLQTIFDAYTNIDSYAYAGDDKIIHSHNCMGKARILREGDVIKLDSFCEYFKMSREEVLNSIKIKGANVLKMSRETDTRQEEDTIRFKISETGDELEIKSVKCERHRLKK